VKRDTRPPAAPRPSELPPGATVDASWRQWIAENRLRDCAPESMLATMLASGLDPQSSAKAIAAMESDPVFLAARKHQKLQRKLESVMGNLQQLWSSAPTYHEVDRRESVSEDEFTEKYVRGCRPVILTGLAKDWPALKKWTPAYLKEHFGSNVVQIQARRDTDRLYEPNKAAHHASTRLDEFVDRVLAAGRSNSEYLTANNEVLRNPAFAPLLNDIGTLPSVCDRSRLADQSSFWFGPGGTITSLHHDALMLFHTQVLGRKRWRLMSPLETPNLYNFFAYYSPVNPDAPDLRRFPRFSNVRVVEAVLEPGDTIFLPLAWWHEVTSLDVSISFSFSNLKIPNRFSYDNPDLWNWM
jgi:hypothetical protein